ncbi:MAG: hypothetical protein ACX94B_13115 [Henriciella sp.]
MTDLPELIVVALFFFFAGYHCKSYAVKTPQADRNWAIHWTAEFIIGVIVFGLLYWGGMYR